MKQFVSPETIVSFIDQYLPEAASPESARKIIVGQRRGVFVTLLDLIESLPEGVLPSDESDHLLLILATNQIRAILEEILTRGDRELQHIPNTNRKNALVEIRRIIETCPTQFIPEEISGLEFVKDSGYRTILREDLKEFESYLQNRQWKASTTLGGALLEAILLDTLDGDRDKALKCGLAPKKNDKVKDLENWGLHSCLEVAHELKMLSDAAYKIGMCAKDARNLIHPGRAIRLDLSFDTGTAYAVKAALENTFRDLTKWHGPGGSP